MAVRVPAGLIERRVTVSGQPLTSRTREDPVVLLQRTIGNRATSRLVADLNEVNAPACQAAVVAPDRALMREKICVPGNEGSPECHQWERTQAAAPPWAPKSRFDLKPDADALHGIAPYYMATDVLPRNVSVNPDYVFRFADWLMIPYARAGSTPLPPGGPPRPVLYFLAWKPAPGARNELVVGPNELEAFLANPEGAKTLRNQAYWFQRDADEWGDGQPNADEVYLAKSLMQLANGELRAGFSMWLKAWAEQAKNPLTWLNVLTALGGSVKGTWNATKPPIAPDVTVGSETPTGAGPSVTPAPPSLGAVVGSAEALVELPNGQRVGPDSYSGGYYGTAEDHPDVVLRDGLPARGTDMRLREHSEGNPNSGLRGTTNIVSDGDGRGAAYWAHEGGYVYEIRRVPTWDVNKQLQGRVDAGGGYRGNLMHGEGEYAIPARVPREKIVRWGIVKDRGGDRLYVDWHTEPAPKP